MAEVETQFSEFSHVFQVDATTRMSAEFHLENAPPLHIREKVDLQAHEATVTLEDASNAATCCVVLEYGLGQPLAHLKLMPDDQLPSSRLRTLLAVRLLAEQVLGKTVRRMYEFDEKGSRRELLACEQAPAFNFNGDRTCVRWTLETVDDDELFMSSLLQLKLVHNRFQEEVPSNAKALIWQFLRNPCELLIASHVPSNDFACVDVISLQSGAIKSTTHFNHIHRNDVQDALSGPMVAKQASGERPLSTVRFADGFQVRRVLAGIQMIHRLWWKVPSNSSRASLKYYHMGPPHAHAEAGELLEVVMEKDSTGLSFAGGIVAASLPCGWAACIASEAGSTHVNIYDTCSGNCCMQLELHIIGEQGVGETELLASDTSLLSIQVSGQNDRPFSKLEFFVIDMVQGTHQRSTDRCFNFRMKSLSMFHDVLAAVEDLEPRSSHEGDVVLCRLDLSSGISLPFHRLHGRFRAVALTSEFIATYTWQHSPSGATEPGCVMVWTRLHPSTCVWHSGSLTRVKFDEKFNQVKHDVPVFLGFSARMPGEAPHIEDWGHVGGKHLRDSNPADNAKSSVEIDFATVIEPMYTNVPGEEPAYQIDPDEASAVNDELWATGIERLAVAGSSVADRDGRSQVVLLTFSRRPEELGRILMETPLAQRLIQEDVNLRPSWANGALVLVKDLGPDDVSDIQWPWNVAVRVEDEVEVMDALRQLPYNIRPRVKPGIGRFQLPGDGSLFHDVSDVAVQVAATMSHDSETSLLDIEGAGNWREVVVVERTFLHVPVPPMAETRSVPHSI